MADTRPAYRSESKCATQRVLKVSPRYHFASTEGVTSVPQLELMAHINARGGKLENTCRKEKGL